MYKQQQTKSWNKHNSPT